MNPVHCPMIHGGLQLYLKQDHSTILANQCCLRDDLVEVTDTEDIFNNPKLTALRTLNNTQQWDPGCANCQQLENAQLPSFRTGTLAKFGEQTDYNGPIRLDLMFDRSCNLACRTCGPNASSYWQKHLKDNGEWSGSIDQLQRSDEVIGLLKNINLSQLEMIVFCGGETLMGNAYWEVADAIAGLIPNCRDQVTLCFQTNGTQPIDRANFKIIEKYKLVKLHISCDGIGDTFNYLRWPATFDQFFANILTIRNRVPNNVMFLVEQTISIFNFSTIHQLTDLANGFAANRDGDPVEITAHLANGIYSLESMTQEYYDAMLKTNYSGLLPKNFVENPKRIKTMIAEIQKVDHWRNQNWLTTFPDLAVYYNRYLPQSPK